MLIRQKHPEHSGIKCTDNSIRKSMRNTGRDNRFPAGCCPVQRALLKTHNHGGRTAQLLGPGLRKPGLLHPSYAVVDGVIKTVRGFN